jgi:hypothetical protein
MVQQLLSDASNKPVLLLEAAAACLWTQDSRSRSRCRSRELGLQPSQCGTAQRKGCLLVLPRQLRVHVPAAMSIAVL